MLSYILGHLPQFAGVADDVALAGRASHGKGYLRDYLGYQKARRLGTPAPGKTFRSGLMASTKAARSTLMMPMFQLPLAAFMAGMAPKGHKLSSGAGQMAPMLGSAIGTLFGGMPGAIIGGFAGDALAQSALGTGMQWLHDFDQSRRKLGMGGDYVDTQTAFTMRARASQQLSGSLLNARHWLGKEAALMSDV